MANIVFELSADEQKLVTGLLRAKRAMDDLESSTSDVAKAAKDADEKLQKAADQTVKHHQGFARAMEQSKSATDGLSLSIAGMAGGWFTVQKAVEIASDVMEARLNRVKTLAENLKNQTQSITAGLSATGSYELMPQVRQQVQELSKRYDVDANMLGKTFQQLSTSGIASTPQGLMETLDQSARMSKLGYDPVAAGKMMLGARDVWGNMSAGESADFAARAMRFMPEGLDENAKKMMGMAKEGGLSTDQTMQFLIARARAPSKVQVIDEVMRMVGGGGPSDEDIQKSLREVAPESASKQRAEISARREQLKSQVETLESEREQKRRAWQDEDLADAAADAKGTHKGKYAGAQKAEDVATRKARVEEERIYEDKLATLRADEQRLAKQDSELAKQKVMEPTSETWRMQDLRSAMASGSVEEKLNRLAGRPELLGEKGDKLGTRRTLKMLAQGYDAGPGMDEREAAYRNMLYTDPASYYMERTEATRAERSRGVDTEGVVGEYLHERHETERLGRKGAKGLVSDVGEAVGLHAIEEVKEREVARLASERHKREAEAQRVVIVNDQRAAPAREAGGAGKER
ncbi:MAG: hypothetical protein ABFD89_21970 [Bryobacteraceae bacterium]